MYGAQWGLIARLGPIIETSLRTWTVEHFHHQLLTAKWERLPRCFFQVNFFHRSPHCFCLHFQFVRTFSCQPCFALKILQLTNFLMSVWQFSLLHMLLCTLTKHYPRPWHYVSFAFSPHLPLLLSPALWCAKKFPLLHYFALSLSLHISLPSQ